MKKIVLCLLATCFMSLNALAEREIKGQVVYEKGRLFMRPTESR